MPGLESDPPDLASGGVDAQSPQTCYLRRDDDGPQRVSFRPAPKRPEPEPAKEASKFGSILGLELGYYLGIGTMLLTLLAIPPVLRAIHLTWDPSYLYFIGRSISIAIISVCVVPILIFATLIIIMIFLRYSYKLSLHGFIQFFTTIVTVLGFSLFFVALPLKSRSAVAYEELMANCGVGQMTGSLASTYADLLEMRLRPSCLREDTIEHCGGYQEHSPYTGFLKAIELGSRCSGFCYTGTPNITNVNKPSESTQGSLLLQLVSSRSRSMQASGAHPHGALVKALRDFAFVDSESSLEREHSTPSVEQQDTQPISLLTPGRASLAQQPRDVGQMFHLRALHNLESTGWRNAYPPTLFTNANYSTSCDGAAARDIRYNAEEVARLLYLEGAGLLLISAGVSFLRLLAMCRQQQKLAQMGTVNNEESQSFAVSAAKAAKAGASTTGKAPGSESSGRDNTAQTGEEPTAEEPSTLQGANDAATNDALQDLLGITD